MVSPGLPMVLGLLRSCVICWVLRRLPLDWDLRSPGDRLHGVPARTPVPLPGRPPVLRRGPQTCGGVRAVRRGARDAAQRRAGHAPTRRHRYGGRQVRGASAKGKGGRQWGNRVFKWGGGGVNRAPQNWGVVREKGAIDRTINQLL